MPGEAADERAFLASPRAAWPAAQAAGVEMRSYGTTRTASPSANMRSGDDGMAVRFLD